jgi:4-carboxymuconolactone decarboxylase
MAKPEIHDNAPALGWYTDTILFGEMWERPNIPKRDRSLVTCSVLITLNYTQQLIGHLTRALNFGVTPTEITEILAHLAFYSGWPCAMSAVPVMKQVFDSQGVKPDQVRQSLGSSPIQSADLPTDVPVYGEFNERVIEKDMWLRTELAPRDRSLVTLAALAAQSQLEPLRAEARRAKANGLTQKDAYEGMSHLGFYAGWGRAASALAVLKSVYEG